MAEAVRESVSDAAERAEYERVVPPLSRPRDSSVVFGGRFALAYLLLVVVFGGVIALFAYLVSRPDPQPWSSFKPGGDGLARASQIANHVAPNYRDGSEQIVVVEAQPPIVQNRLIDAVAVARDRIQAVGGGLVSVEPARNTIFYVFCGLGQSCALRNPTPERLPLLRRESLELALYTFKYMGDIDSVVALLPPQGQETPAVYLRRRAFLAQLEQPLRETLPGQPPFTHTRVADRATVDRLTEHRTFPSYFQPTQNGGVMLRLGGPPPEESDAQQPQQQQP